MSTTPPPLSEKEMDRLSEMATRLDCLTEHDLMLLAGITPATAEAWRRRGTGPGYVLVGNRYFYPRKSVAAYMENRARSTNVATARGSL
ncbi:helix-turn-helix transcriptional regulator [Variovorax sp. PvP013]|uniref:helix-turn-helix transcriptional regulator n=1 Tax=Variovorax sp. PvP013 TaxID=3156435 RepID=UPI003D24CA0D